MSSIHTSKTLFSLLVKDTLRELFNLMGPSAVYLHPIPEFAPMMRELFLNWDQIADPIRCDEFVRYVPLKMIIYLKKNIVHNYRYKNIIKAIPKYGRLDILSCLHNSKLFTQYSVNIKRYAISAIKYGYPKIARYIINKVIDTTPLDIKCKVACGLIDDLTDEDYIEADEDIMRLAAKYGHINIIDKIMSKSEYLEHNNGLENAGHHDIKIIKEIIKRIPKNKRFNNFDARYCYLYAAKHSRIDTLEWLSHKGYSIGPSTNSGIKYYTIEVAMWIYAKLLDEERIAANNFLNECIYKDRIDIFYNIIAIYDNIDPSEIIDSIMEKGDKEDLDAILEYNRKQQSGYYLTVGYETFHHAIKNHKCAYYMIERIMEIDDGWDHDDTEYLFQRNVDGNPYYFDLVCDLVNLFEKKYKTNKHFTREIAIKRAEYYGHKELIERLKGNNTN